MTYDGGYGFDDDEDRFAFLDEYSFEDFYSDFDDDSDKAISLVRFPNYNRRPPQACKVPPQFRHIRYGEITAAGTRAQALALANLNQSLMYPGLRPVPAGTPGRFVALAQYDPQGTVTLRILSPDQSEIVWQGRLKKRIQMPPTGHPQRNQLIEERVRRLIARVTGRPFGRHGGVYSGGPDLVQLPIRPRFRRALQRRGIRFGRGGRASPTTPIPFDAFDDLLV